MNKEEILAMSAGRELDALVGEKVMRLDMVEGRLPQLPKHYHPDYDRTIFQDVPLYSSDISAAWEVVEKLKLKLQIFTYFHDVEGFEDGWCVKIDGKHVEGVEKAPEAICKAALLAVME